MGLKVTDVYPNLLGSTGPTATTPPNKQVYTKVFAIARRDTDTVKCVLPADSTIIDIRAYSEVVSDAGTASVLRVGIPGTPTYFFSGVDVKGTRGKLTISTLSNIYQLENVPQNGDIQITGANIETGTPSTTGGPFYITVEYVR